MARLERERQQRVERLKEMQEEAEKRQRKLVEKKKVGARVFSSSCHFRVGLLVVVVVDVVRFGGACWTRISLWDTTSASMADRGCKA